jgi:CHAT domain-containing protein/Flp pilus assembly protein TadD
MRLSRIGLTALLTLVANLAINDFSLIQNPKSKIQNSWTLAQTPDAREAEADRLFEQGNKQYNASQFEAALQSFQQALKIYREIKNSQGEKWALGNLGLAYHSLGNYAKAIEYQQQSLALARQIQDRKGEGQALTNLGLAYYNLGDYAKAIEYHQQSLAIAREIQDRTIEKSVLSNLGIAYDALGNYPKAIEYYQQSLEIAKAIGDRKGEGGTLANLGVTYHWLGEYAKAIEYHQQHLAIARELQDRKGEGIALGNLGIVYNSLGDYTKAIKYYQQDLAIARQIQNRKGERIALGNLGNAYRSLGDNAKAIEYYQQSLAIAKTIQDRKGERTALGNLGNAYRSLRDNAKAIEYYQQSLAIAKAIGDRKGEGIVLRNLGIVSYLLGNYTKAIEYSQQSLAIAKAMGDRPGEGSTLNDLGFILYKQGNLALAEKTLIDGIKVRESLRTRLDDTNKISIFETQSNTYNTLQKVLIAQNKTDAALEIAERGRARAFVDLLARRLSSNPTEQPSITPPTIEQIKQIAKAQNSTLVQYSIIYEDFKVKDKLQYKESELYIWVIKPTGEVTFRRSDLKPLWQQQNITLEDLVYSSRDSIGVRDLPIVGVVPRPGVEKRQEVSLTQQLQQLHQLLIEPIADLLPTDPSDRVIFIPQEELFLAPFPAFKDKQGKYLIEKHTILTVPSIQVLDLTRKQRERVGAQDLAPLQTNNALVVGNPTMPSVRSAFDQPPQQLSSLPGAEQEAQAIAPLLNTKPLIGKDATKSAIEQLMPKARIIHLATHGILDDERGIGSAIALAPSGKDDGLLKAEQILDMKLNAELVVLSACNTGRGRITGDGVIGLSRSLISAGVPSVLVSLWSVPDAPTAFLMTEFYRNLQQNPNKAQALRQAMFTTMKQHPNPKDWAAFTLIGEAE